MSKLSVARPSGLKTFVFSVVACSVCTGASFAQFSSGSDGTDGALSPAVDTIIDLSLDADTIYHYTSVNIPEGVTVSFGSNESNSTVTWLVQGACTIAGTLSITGSSGTGVLGGAGGPGGFRGGDGAPQGISGGPGVGHGPGGGIIINANGFNGGSGSYATAGGGGGTFIGFAGDVYGSRLLLPLIGGSGGAGGGQTDGAGGGGGGGAILIAADTIELSGQIDASGGGGVNGPGQQDDGGAGSGGGVRLVAKAVTGAGTIVAAGGFTSAGGANQSGGLGRVRLEGDISGYTGDVTGTFTFTRTPGILILPAGAIPVLSIAMVGTEAVPANPTGNALNPDVILSVGQANPVTVVVESQQLSPGTLITVTAWPDAGGRIRSSAAAEGTLETSTASIDIDLPGGAGVLLAQAVDGVAKNIETSTASFSQTGLAPNGERFSKREVSAGLGGISQLVFITESGARYPFSTGG